jgi:hypothetical protein
VLVVLVAELFGFPMGSEGLLFQLLNETLQVIILDGLELDIIHLLGYLTLVVFNRRYILRVK